jgi:hypothetical protein
VNLGDNVRFGSTPLHFACYLGGRTETVALLVREPEIEVNVQDKASSYSIHLSVQISAFLLVGRYSSAYRLSVGF